MFKPYYNIPKYFVLLVFNGFLNAILWFFFLYISFSSLITTFSFLLSSFSVLLSFSSETTVFWLSSSVFAAPFGITVGKANDTNNNMTIINSTYRNISIIWSFFYISWFTWLLWLPPSLLSDFIGSFNNSRTKLLIKHIIKPIQKTGCVNNTLYVVQSLTSISFDNAFK